MSVKEAVSNALDGASDRIEKNVETGKRLAEEETGEEFDDSLMADTRGQVGTNARQAVGLVVGLMVGGIVAAFLLPVAVDEIVGVDTSSWGSGASSLWDILDLIIVLAVFLFFIGMALSYS